jgi:adenosylmethionine-8-amino-7-oxononanoate aminotransferase
MLFNVKRVPVPSHDMHISLDALENELKSNAEGIAGVVMESGAQIAGGAVIYPEYYQREVKRLCERYSTLLILDEVATGFGRLGSMVEYTAQGSIPDIVAFGKMLTAGYMPLAATLTTDEVYNAFLGEYDEYKHLFHGHTFTGNPIACACAIANIRLYEKERLIERVRDNARVIGDRAREFMEYGIVGDVRYKGMLLAVELVDDRTTMRALRLKDKRINYAITEKAFKRNLFLRPLGNIMLIIPPLAMGKDELNVLVDNAISIVDELEREVKRG